MHILVHIIILFIFVFVLLLFNFPQLESNQHIKQKLYIFAGIFIFEFIISLIIAFYKKCIIDFRKIAKNSLQSALLGAIAYSVYNDLVWSNNPWIPLQNNDITKNLTISILITVFITMGYLFDYVLMGTAATVNDCLNTIYPQINN